MNTNYWALIIDGLVRDVITEDPKDRYHPSLQWVGANASVKSGMKYQHGQFTEVVPVIDYVMVERSWRDSELTRADYELNKVQDSDTNSVGSVGVWREYRKLLRAWPQSVDFPDNSKRPVAPDA